MKKNNLIAKATTSINAPRSDVWDALVTPESIKQYMFGTDVTSKFYEGSPITWRGEWQGKVYEDKGKVLKVNPGRVLQFSHYSPLSGLPDRPDNYHIVTIELIDKGGEVKVVLTQDKNLTEEARQHSEKNWQMVLDALKQLIEAF
jgi:uncharacterized protein YndB with AHSA1/START domain